MIPNNPRNSPLLNLKIEGHEVIRELETLGIKLNGPKGIYHRLARKMNKPVALAHFGNIHNIPDATHAVKTLQAMRDEIVRSRAATVRHLEERAFYKKNTLPIREQKRLGAIVAEQNRKATAAWNAPKSLPWYSPQRWIEKLSTLGGTMVKVYTQE